MIQVFKPAMGDEEVRAVSEVLRSGWIGLGPRTQEFERRFAEYIGVEHCIGVNSCTSALDLALKLLDIHRGDEVLVPTMTFVSTAHVVAYNDATPIFCEPDETTLGIDLEDAARRISPRTRAIICVHYGGRMVDPDRLRAFADTHGLAVIEDCAHATGASHDGRMAGSIGDIGCFSFHAVKNLAMGDGGALTLGNTELAERARRLRWLGIDKGTWKRTENDRSYWWEYSVGEIGLKCHMNDIAAAIGLVQLDKLERHNDRRREIASLYHQGLGDLPQVVLPPLDEGNARSAWHIFAVLAHGRDDLSVHLRDSGVNTGVHYKPIHLYRCYGQLAALPRAEAIFSRLLSLPMYPDLTDDDVELVISSVRSFYGHESRPASGQSAAEGADLPQVTLRPVASDDLERLRGWRNDPEIRKWFFDDREISADDQQRWFERYSADEDDQLFIIVDDSGRSVGTIGLDHIDHRHGTAEVGRCVIGERSALGRGTMTAATIQICRHAFESCKLRRLVAEIRVDNVRSIAFFERVGFQTEGVLRSARIAEGRPHDVRYMALLADAFTGVAASLARTSSAARRPE